MILGAAVYFLWSKEEAKKFQEKYGQFTYYSPEYEPVYSFLENDKAIAYNWNVVNSEEQENMKKAKSYIDPEYNVIREFDSGYFVNSYMKLKAKSLDEYSVNRGLKVWIPGTMDWMVWRGQTEMIRDHDTNAMDRWQSYDTLSVHHRRPFHRLRETMPLAWSGVEIAKDPKQSMDRLNGQASSQKHDNGTAYRLIDRSGFWSARAYLGLPAVRDLDENSKAMRENNRFPTDKVTVIGVIQKKNTINTADQTGLGAGRLKLKDAFADFHGDAAMVAMSSAQVYFRRPPGGNERVEYASMYSPYWQVRLVGVDAHERGMVGALGTLWR